jgi:IS5 family transposase
VGLLVRADDESAVLPESQQHVTCRVDEVAVADVFPRHVADGVALDRTESARRGKSGSKIHLITDRNGVPLSVGVSGAGLHDSRGLEALVRGIPPDCSRRALHRRRRAELHVDKRYDYDRLRRWLRERGIRPCIARKGIEFS